ncbi:hypothetical protein T4A_9313 [Trichinella pseudospiralis]|uniref:Uncharacterized protein n=1 Tax=Trichinella pseudospiralis TaxID=6337 RepID=A0A0V1EIL4_TRIPS|nr:hypothetical protein T4A_9313 [Trichinella pseudospiralis]
MGRNWEETENKQYDSPSCGSSLTIHLRRDIWHQKREWESNLTSPSSRTPRVDADLTSWDGNRSRAFGRICTNN